MEKARFESVRVHQEHRSDGGVTLTVIPALDRRADADVEIVTALKGPDGEDLPAGGLISTTNAYKITVALVTKDSLLPLAYGTADVVAKTSG